MASVNAAQQHFLVPRHFRAEGSGHRGERSPAGQVGQEHDAEHERRHADGHRGDHGDQHVGERVALDRGDDAGDHADDHVDEDRHERQPHGVRQHIDQHVRHGPALVVLDSEVPGGEVAEVGEVLLVERLVEAEDGPVLLGDRGRHLPVAGRRERVAQREGAEEDEQRGGEYHEDGLADPAQDELAHEDSLSRRGPSW